jgi:hypothetical protein
MEDGGRDDSADRQARAESLSRALANLARRTTPDQAYFNPLPLRLAA